MPETIRSPYELSLKTSVLDLVEMWEAARQRSFIARRVDHVDPEPEDQWTELAVGARLAEPISAGRWCVVADLLRAGHVDSWADVGTALNMTETDARDGFHRWITGQVDLSQRSAYTIGLTDDSAEELRKLSAAITW